MSKFIFPIILSVLISSCTSKKFNQQQQSKIIETTLNQWHNAAATANEDAFFNQFTQNGIYIGTDATEHWKATELRTWAKKAFQRDSAWVFHPYDRHIYFSNDGKTAWFDELLKTWMGTCRGSGVLELEDNEWKIAHYHLSVTVPNEKMEDFLRLMN